MRVDDVCTSPPLLDRIDPPLWSDLLMPRFKRFRRLYRTLRPLFPPSVSA